MGAKLIGSTGSTRPGYAQFVLGVTLVFVACCNDSDNQPDRQREQSDLSPQNDNVLFAQSRNVLL